VIERLSWLSQEPLYWWAKDNLYLVGLMIDGGEDIIQTELQMGEQKIVFGDGGKRFKFSHKVVAKVADGSAPKTGQAWGRLNPRAGK
jgi:hypothetical protein